MRVAHVVRQYLPSLGGLEEVVRNLVQQQLKQGLQPYIITLDRVFKQGDQALPANEIIDGVEIIRIPYFGSNRYPIAPSVLKHLKQADLVHVHAIDFFYDFLALTKWLHKKPLVVTTHGGFFHSNFASILKKIYFKTITKLSSLAYRKVIGCSDNDGVMFSQIIHDDKLCVIENGVDIEKFHAAASEALQPVLIYFGRWSSNKGLFEAIQVMRSLKLQDKQNAWRMIICGRAYDIQASDLLEYANSLELADSVEVYENPTNAQIKQYIGQSSYYVCLSKHEGFGIAPIEAMSAGLFPILSAIPPFEKLVAQTKMGAIFNADQPNSPTAIADALNRLHQTSAINTSAIIEAVKPYAWQHVAHTYLQAYLKAIGKASA